MELLAALAILGALSVMLYSTLSNSLRAVNRGEKNSIELQAYRMAMTRMSADIRSLFYNRTSPQKEPRFYSIIGTSSGSGKAPNDSLEFTAAVPSITGNNPSAPTLRRIRYQIGNPESGPDAKGLIRLEGPVIFEDAPPAVPNVVFVVDEGFAGMNVRFLKKTWGAETWLEQWSSEAEKGPPALFEITLYHLPEDSKSGEPAPLEPFFIDAPLAEAFRPAN